MSLYARRRHAINSLRIKSPVLLMIRIEDIRCTSLYLQFRIVAVIPDQETTLCGVT